MPVMTATLVGSLPILPMGASGRGCVSAQAVTTASRTQRDTPVRPYCGIGFEQNPFRHFTPVSTSQQSASLVQVPSSVGMQSSGGGAQTLGEFGSFGSEGWQMPRQQSSCVSQV